MRAVSIARHGPPEVLETGEVPAPRLTPGHALVRVRACAVNHLDVHIRRGLERVRVPLPHILGSDIAGDLVEAAGPCDLEPGTRVVVAPGLTCGRCLACISGDDHLCDDFGVVGGYRHDGGYAELVAVPTTNLVRIGGSISYAQAAAMPTAYQTAWHMLVRQARVRAGQWVLVHAAGGGVGTAAVDIAVFLGARVIATAGDDRKLAAARERGATHLVNYRTGDMAEQVRALIGARSVDVVAEQVGAPLFWDSVRLLRPGGTLVTCGATAGHHAEIDLRYLFARNLTLAGAALGPKSDMHRLVGLLGEGRLRPLIDSVVGLDRAPEAHRRIERRDAIGKIVLSVPDRPGSESR
jgi:NADPH:quinone reductase-like Zn-dependent oxidoreductase